MDRKIGLRYQHVSGVLGIMSPDKNLRFESLLEKNFLLLLLFDHNVRKLKSQPSSIQYYNGSYQTKYTPDVFIEYVTFTKDMESTQTIFFEVKPSKILSLEWKNFSFRFKQATKWCREQGYLFKLVTEKYINTPYLANVSFLLQFEHHRFQESNLNKIDNIELQVNKILDHNPLSINELLFVLSQNKTEQQRFLPYIWMLVRHGKLNADLTVPLTMKTIVWNGEPPFDYNFEQSPIRRRLRSRIIIP